MTLIIELLLKFWILKAIRAFGELGSS
ncbi:hypothetical protein F383_19646 [Gossypium arboreum]|uniref:Uncharacterized protein n=1 Tax=Gossypium arboreum TaxID=29729 RepID=A0A0B0NS48_GOSAR|nr:hypothetical protein F383_19646 [Gossypium arboreum]